MVLWTFAFKCPFFVQIRHLSLVAEKWSEGPEPFWSPAVHLHTQSMNPRLCTCTHNQIEFLKPGCLIYLAYGFKILLQVFFFFFKSAGWMASHFDDLFKQFVRSTASCTHMIQNINVSCRCNFSCQLMHQGKMTFMLERCDFSTNSSL